VRANKAFKFYVFTVRGEVKLAVFQRRVTWYMVKWQKITWRCVSPEMQCCVAWQTLTVVVQELSASIIRTSAVWQQWDANALRMEAASSSETSQTMYPLLWDHTLENI
jgi:hypothetical protein